MGVYNLTDKQFIAFLEYTWNTHLDWYQDLFGSILAYEQGRAFDEGMPWCASSLQIFIKPPSTYTYQWNYATTSGTDFEVVNCDYDNIGDVYKVTIPDHRDKPGRVAYTDMQAILAGHAYWSWDEQQDESNPEALSAAAFFAGTTVEELLATRKKEEEEREEKKAKRRQYYELNSEGDYEEFEDEILLEV